MFGSILALFYCLLQLPSPTVPDAPPSQTWKLRATVSPFCRSTSPGETWHIHVEHKKQAAELRLFPPARMKDTETFSRTYDLAMFGNLDKEAIIVHFRVAGASGGSTRTNWILEWISPDGRTCRHEILTFTPEEKQRVVVLLRR